MQSIVVTKIGQHAEHLCSTDHKCHENCDFCSDQHGSKCDAAALYVCASKAGHESRHMCKEKKHACGGECHMLGFFQAVAPRLVGSLQTMRVSAIAVLHICVEHPAIYLAAMPPALSPAVIMSAIIVDSYTALR